MTANPTIVIAGAGSIGCYVGGCLLLAGRDVRLLIRQRLATELATHGLTISDCSGRERQILSDRLLLDTNPSVMAAADLIFVTVKSAATAEIAQQIAKHAKPGAVVVSFQNGVGNADTLREVCHHQTVHPGMVGFNVVHLSEGKFHQATTSALYLPPHNPALAALERVDGLVVRPHHDMQSILWGKLLLNLGNALNALSGLPLYEQLHDIRWRRLHAAMMDEALLAMAKAKIFPAKLTPIPARALPYLLRLPTPIYRHVMAANFTVDRRARSSMAQDLDQGRHTEIDFLQGAVIAMAEEHGVSTPLCRRVADAVRLAETAKSGSPCLAPESLLAP
jgi:2-dehydropantoate 2-reductase